MKKYYFLNDITVADEIFGDQQPTCLDWAEVRRLSDEWERDLFGLMHEADEREISEWGVYDTPTEDRAEAIKAWICNPANSGNCEECPYNEGFSAWPGHRLPCGQFTCWVDLHTTEEEEPEDDEPEEAVPYEVVEFVSRGGQAIETTTPFCDAEKAVAFAKAQWGRMCDADKREATVYALECANPGPEAPDHFDGNKLWSSDDERF